MDSYNPILLAVFRCFSLNFLALDGAPRCRLFQLGPCLLALQNSLICKYLRYLPWWHFELVPQLLLDSPLQALPSRHSNRTASPLPPLNLHFDFVNCVINFPAGIVRQPQTRGMLRLLRDCLPQMRVVPRIQSAGQDFLSWRGEERRGYAHTNDRVEIHPRPALETIIPPEDHKRCRREAERQLRSHIPKQIIAHLPPRRRLAITTQEKRPEISSKVLRHGLYKCRQKE